MQWLCNMYGKCAQLTSKLMNKQQQISLTSRSLQAILENFKAKLYGELVGVYMNSKAAARPARSCMTLITLCMCNNLPTTTHEGEDKRGCQECCIHCFAYKSHGLGAMVLVMQCDTRYDDARRRKGKGLEWIEGRYSSSTTKDALEHQPMSRGLLSQQFQHQTKI